jgi:hypothetical protein
MIFFWCEVWHTRLDVDLRRIRDDTGGFYDKATEFYRTKIKKALDRAGTMDSFDQQKMHDYAAAVATNVWLPEPPSQWKITGLFVPKSKLGVWTYICPPVIKAFVQYMVESYRPSIELLVGSFYRFRSFSVLQF